MNSSVSFSLFTYDFQIQGRFAVSVLNMVLHFWWNLNLQRIPVFCLVRSHFKKKIYKGPTLRGTSHIVSTFHWTPLSLSFSPIAHVFSFDVVVSRSKLTPSQALSTNGSVSRLQARFLFYLSSILSQTYAAFAALLRFWHIFISFAIILRPTSCYCFLFSIEFYFFRIFATCFFQLSLLFQTVCQISERPQPPGFS